MKSVILLGASGSIGSQTLDILDKCRDDFVLLGFSLGHRTRYISSIVRRFPSIKYICLMKKNNYYTKKYPHITFYYGDEGLIDIINYSNADMVVDALVGFVGLRPALETLSRNKILALANKEALVVGGELINKLLAKGKGKLYPIDSEHSAFYKCLKVDSHDVDKLLITASGGAFRRLSRDQLDSVKASDALAHPTWKMGAKITIDCATLVNKAFEIIEVYYLFGYKYDDIEVILHDESYIHSMVKYRNGTIRAEISKPDMHNPIIFALYESNYPFKTYLANDYHDFGPYHFHTFDINRYPMVAHAKTVIDQGGTYGAVFNAANEVAVNAFLANKIPFLAIETIINKCMREHKNKKVENYEQLYQLDKKIRLLVNDMIGKGEY